MKRIKLILIFIIALINQTVIAQAKKAIPSETVVNEFYDAIFADNNTKVKQLLSGKFPASFEPHNRITPLQAAIWQKNITVVKWLVEGGANINSKIKSAVEEAAGKGELEILEYLVSKGGDLKNNDAFSIAGNAGEYNCARFLLLKGARQNSGDASGKLRVFEAAVSKSDYEVLKALRLAPEELDNNNCEGETALIIAVKQNNVEMVKYLLKCGVNKNKPETYDCGDDISYGKKPIDIARKKGYQEVVKLLK